MYRIGDYLVYKKDVCKVKGILEKDTGNYYLLVPVDDSSLKIQVSTDSDGIRKLITRRELDNLINSIPNIETIECDEKMIEYEYKQLLCSGNKEDLIKLIKTGGKPILIGACCWLGITFVSVLMQHILGLL